MVHQIRCHNCKQRRVPETKYLCKACYEYERRYGKPRPREVFKKVSIPRDLFIEEWTHMTKRVGLPRQAAVYRLASAYKLPEDRINNYVERFIGGEVAA